MTPSRLAVQLRQIAQKIDNSKRPDHRLVAKELRRVLSAVEPGKVANRIATQDELQDQQDGDGEEIQEKSVTLRVTYLAQTDIEVDIPVDPTWVDDQGEPNPDHWDDISNLSKAAAYAQLKENRDLHFDLEERGFEII